MVFIVPYRYIIFFASLDPGAASDTTTFRPHPAAIVCSITPR